MKPDEIRRQLAAVCASPMFVAAPRLRDFLQYIVDRVLEGASENLKEYVIGVEVFNRGAGFDPRTDTIVRVQAGRLRRKLAEYYAKVGYADPIVIDVPRGGYVPQFLSRALTGASRGEGLQLARHVVGRDAEIEALEAAWGEVVKGRSRLVGLTGEAGIGKTTLAEAFLRRLTDRKEAVRVARGQCSERLVGSEAYLPVLDALGGLLRNDEEAAAVLRKKAPWWYSQAAFLAESESDRSELSDETRHATQERIKLELVSYLSALSGRRPLLMLIEDLHWSDVATIDVLRYLASRFDSMRLLVLATYRISELAVRNHAYLRVRPDLQSRGRCRELHLRLLKEVDVERYVSLRYAPNDFPADLSDLVFRRTDGSPLFTADLLQSFEDQHLIAREDGCWTLTRPVQEILTPLPDSVKGMIQRKIDHLSDEDRRLLETASVQGFTFDVAALAATLSDDEETVEDRLRVLAADHGFVELTDEGEYPDRRIRIRYRFVHVLYQEEFYDSLTSAKRVRLSKALAETLERLYGSHVQEAAPTLAGLFESAREPRKAMDYLAQAAQRAVQRFAFHEAISLGERGLGLLKSVPSTPDRDASELALQVALAGALTAIQGYGQSRVGDAYARVRELGKAMGSEPRAVRATIGLASYYLVTAQLSKSLELAQEHLRLAQRDDDSNLLRTAHSELGMTEQFLGNFPSGSEHLEQVLQFEDAELEGARATSTNQDVLVTTLDHLAFNMWVLGYPDQAVHPSRTARKRAEELQNPFLLTHYLGFAGFLHQCRGEVDKVLELSEENIAVSNEHGYMLNIAWASMHKGWALAQRGDPTEGLAMMKQGIETWRATGMVAMVPYWHSLMGDTYARLGQPDEGLSLLEESLNVVQATEHRFFEAEVHRTRGLLLLERGQAATAAAACFERALETARRQQAKSYELRAAVDLSRLWLREERRDEAQRLLSETYGWFSEGFDTHDLREASALLGGMASACRATGRSP